MAYHIQYQQLTEENLLKKADGQLVRMKSLLVFQIPLQTHGNKTFLRGDYI